MKRMTGKGGILAAAAIVLLAAVLVTGCFAPVEGLFTGGEKIPEGKGAVRLTIGSGGNARTIMPSAPAFTSYAVKILDGGNATIKTDALSSNTGSYQLNEGDYTIKVEASTGGGLAAVGERSIHITAGQTTAISIQLEMIDFAAATAPGTFSYNITTSGVTGLTAAAMTVTAKGSYGKSPATSSASNNVYNLAGSANNRSGSIPLEPGFYSVVFELKNNVNTIFYREVLHVYQNMTSNFQFTFTDAHFPSPGNAGVTITAPSLSERRLGLAHSSGGTWSGTLAADNLTLTIRLSSSPGRITVSGAGTLSEVAWYINPGSGAPLTAGISGSGNSVLTVTPGPSGNFDKGTYSIVVEGIDRVGGTNVFSHAKFKIVVTD